MELLERKGATEGLLAKLCLLFQLFFVLGDEWHLFYYWLDEVEDYLWVCA
jgi:hypothetical protein